ncbi:MAG: hypothetical protein O9331_08985, partial [Acidovorax sp.]|nr:hypothetical protein [Acidovorax sp.]
PSRPALTVLSPDPISVSSALLNGCDDPEILTSRKPLNCLKSADGGQAREAQRVRQQGHGRPIISSISSDGKRSVQIGDKLVETESNHFLDFILCYLRDCLGADWIAAELKRALPERHIVLQWYHHFQQIKSKSKTTANSCLIQNFGVLNALAGLGYGFYLLRHNVELQEKLIKRIRDRLQFQGAYYEVLVASILIRAGFKLELEDETDISQRHCEFSARSQDTGELYSIECKARSVPGVLHKAALNASKKHRPTSMIIAHLKDALRQPAIGERIVFIDVNTPAERVQPPSWVAEAENQLARYKRDRLEPTRAFVLITNVCFHLHLTEIDVPVSAFMYGFNIPDFAYVGGIRFSHLWKSKRKYQDIHNIGKFYTEIGAVPSTFDGSLASTTLFGELPPVQIGERYMFTDSQNPIGKVSSAVVSESEGVAYVAVSGDNGENVILSQQLSETQLADYREHRETYFGEISRNANTKDEFELYEWLVKTHMQYTRGHILEQLKDSSQLDEYKLLDDEGLVLTYCERLIAFMRQQQSEAKCSPSSHV